MVKKDKKNNEDRDMSRQTGLSGLVEQIGKENMNKLEDLFSKVKKGDEFEFMFFGRKGRYLPQEKYIQLLKYFSNGTYKIVGPNDTLDITFSPDNETNYRCTIVGTNNINKFMRKVSMLRNHVVFKTLTSLWVKNKNTENFGIELMKKEKKGEELVDIDDFDLRARKSKESNVSKEELDMLFQINETSMNKIRYRYKQRTSVFITGNEDSDEFVRVDLTYTRMADIFKRINSAVPNYEIEIEYGTKTSSKKESLNIMMKQIEIILKIIQQSNHIISRQTIGKVIEYYKNLFSIQAETNIGTIDGRQVVTLEIQHVTEALPNKYAVTDKADGERHFLMICDNHCYLLSQNLDIRDTGIILPESLSEYNGSILDGELIFVPNKNRHLFLVWDCLFHKGVDVRPLLKIFERIAFADDVIEKCFIFGKQKGFKFDKEPNTQDFNLSKKLTFHHNQISNMISTLNSDIELEKQYPLIRRKYFIGALGARDWEIFAYASTMWTAFTESPDVKCPYFLDGLIFQPLEQAYISNAKESRFQDFKWKPEEKNSLDLYIEFETDADGKIVSVYDNSYDDFVRNKPYRICKLYVGQRNKGMEVPVLFKEEQDLHIANLFLDNGEVRDLDGNILSDKTVVEFYYNNNPEVLERFKWVPIRTRYDKTESVIRFGRKYGNYVTVADKVWRSIINPVLMSDFDDLAKGNIPEKNLYFYDKKVEQLRKKIGHELIISATKENVYFQKRTEIAKPMRNFHNWIKSNMIYTFAHPMYQNNRQLSVLDIGCGKGQDIMKYYYSMAAFYVGIDPDREGLVSATDGAISRYNQQRRRKPNFPKMYFIQADGTADLDLESQKRALNVRKLENEEFFKKFFSAESKDRTMFDIVSIQFAIHYMIRNDETWGCLKRNINNYLRNGGFLLITTFDAEKVMKLLSDKDKYTQEYTDENGKTQILFEIVKKYQNVEKDVLLGPGNPIDVYISWFSQEGRYLTEYLVDSRFVSNNLKEECGLELIDTDSFGNQMTIHEPYLLQYAKYEEVDETRNYLANVADFYKSNEVNDGCKVWNKLFRYYVFRKNSSLKQKGGDNVIDFSDTSKFIVPSMNKNGYDNEYSCMNSIHHVLKNHRIIPGSVTPKKLCSDLGLKFISDNDIIEKLPKIAKNIKIEHNIEDKNKNQIVIDGLNVFLIERDCNDVYDVELISNKKSSSAVILMKEGTWYVPVYNIDPESHKRMGLYEMNNPIVTKLMEEL